VAGGKHSDSRSANPLFNRLHLLFVDGQMLSLAPEDLVTQLAAQHQAAPCEYQILRALQSRLGNTSSATSRNNRVDWKQLANSLVDAMAPSTNTPVTVLPFESPSWKASTTLPTRDLTRAFDRTPTTTTKAYDNDDPGGGNYVWMTTLGDTTPADGVFADFQQVFLGALTDHWKNVTLIRAQVVPPCVDGHAASITMLQHVAYQGRLANVCLAQGCPATDQVDPLPASCQQRVRVES
jgi:hypothetical protein